MKLCTPHYLATSFASRNQPFAGLFRHPFTNVPNLAPFFGQSDAETTPPTHLRPTDLFEDAEHYFARFEVPGVKKEDLSIELKDLELNVTASAKAPSNDGEKVFTASRSLSLPVGITADNITAKLENGLLTLTLPKPAEQKPRAISVE